MAASRIVMISLSLSASERMECILIQHPKRRSMQRAGPGAVRSSLDDNFSKVFGLEKRGHVRCMGLGVNPTRSRGVGVQSQSTLETSQRESALLKQNEDLQLKLDDVLSCQSILESQVAYLMRIVAKVQKRKKKGTNRMKKRSG